MAGAMMMRRGFIRIAITLIRIARAMDIARALNRRIAGKLLRMRH